jgi:hypothetical protein
MHFSSNPLRAYVAAQAPTLLAAPSTGTPISPLTPAAGTGASLTTPVVSAPWDADEAIITQLLRLLDQADSPRPLSPVERAFITGGKEILRQLIDVCDGMLARMGPTAGPLPKPAAPAVGAHKHDEPLGFASAPAEPAGNDSETPSAGAGRRPRKSER